MKLGGSLIICVISLTIYMFHAQLKGVLQKCVSASAGIIIHTRATSLCLSNWKSLTKSHWNRKALKHKDDMYD